MRVWRMVATRFADAAFDGEGAARYSGRWNPHGVRMVYTADSLALATLELTVHLFGARLTYTSIEVEIPDAHVSAVSARQLTSRWRDDEAVSQRVGESWVRAGSSLCLRVPSALVDVRSGERNVLINPAHPLRHTIIERQRFEVVLDERLR